MAQLGIFVSHSSQDSAFCRTLVQGLKHAGADVWFDEQNLGPVTLREEISRQLVSRPVFVVVLSASALSSKWVRDECEWAYQLLCEEPNRIVLPVLAQPITLADFNASGLLYLKGMKRVEGKGLQPLPTDGAIQQMLRLLELAHPSDGAQSEPQPAQHDPAEDLMRGKSLVAQGNFHAASEVLKETSAISSKSFDAWFNLGESLRQQGEWADAASAYDRAVALNDVSWAAWYGKGDALNHLRQYVDGLATLEHAIATIDENKGPTPYIGDGYRSSEIGKLVGSLIVPGGSAIVAGVIASHFEVQQKQRRRAQTWTGCGEARLGLTHYSQALAAFEKALTAVDGYTPALRGKAAALRALGQVIEAQQIEQTLQQRNW